LKVSLHPARALNNAPKKSKDAASSAPAKGQFVAVELALRKPLAEQQPTCGLAVVLPAGRRIEVRRDFDVHTFERLMSALERV
jgi:hypothetical protein